MSDDTSKKRLGRGLAALIGEMDQPYDVQEVPDRPPPAADQHVPIEFVDRNVHNPRRSFDEEELEDLARSINQHGIVQPVVVRPTDQGRYEIIAGERRWRAAQRAGLVKGDMAAPGLIRVGLGIVVAEMPAAAFPALPGTGCNQGGGGTHI